MGCASSKKNMGVEPKAMPNVPQKAVLVANSVSDPNHPDARWDKLSSRSDMVASTAGSTEANSGKTSSPSVNGGVGGGSAATDAEQPTEEAGNAQDQDLDGKEHVCDCGKCGCSLNIDANATMLDGIRSLLAHHLRNADVICLSESQVELLEHHSARLASYAQKIVQTITFAQHVVSQVTDAQRVYQAREPPKEVPRKKPKKLKLSDGELLSIYGKARREAEKEADWRGLDENVAFDVRSNRMPPVAIQELVLERPPDAGGVAIEAGMVGDTERRAAIGLLGQALAAREQADPEDVLKGGAQDIAQRIIPAGPLRPWDTDLLDDRGYACCRPVLPSDDALGSKYMPMLPPEPNSAAKATT